jgi:hypothetical protein
MLNAFGELNIGYDLNHRYLIIVKFFGIKLRWVYSKDI